jgi:CDP-diacylglycerol--glycerol-3-phosphate 3-phosphatidyltransferase
MSASRQHARDLARGASIVPGWVKQAARAILAPIVRLALALRLTPNTITVIGLAIVVVASALVGLGWLLIGAAILTAGSLLDAVDGALARARGGGTPFGAFFDSTLDRAAEAIVFVGVAAYFMRFSGDPFWPVVACLVALAASFMVSYARARAEGIGLDAEVGLAPRTERLVLVIAGIALAGLGFQIGLVAAVVVVAALSAITVVQRITHVWRLSVAQTESKES